MDVAALRKRLGITRSVFQRLTGYSERSLADWEADKRPVDGLALRRFRELSRLHAGLSRIMKPTHIAEWLQTPNTAFNDLKPLEVIERGEADRLWQMIYELESGMPR